jgi:hypothetical protein
MEGETIYKPPTRRADCPPRLPRPRTQKVSAQHGTQMHRFCARVLDERNPFITIPAQMWSAAAPRYGTLERNDLAGKIGTTNEATPGSTATRKFRSLRCGSFATINPSITNTAQHTLPLIDSCAWRRRRRSNAQPA